jgi:N-formylglutamate amidohydrolase
MKTLLHIPHSSYSIPFKYQKLFYLNPLDLRKEQIKMTDSYTEDLFNINGIKKLIFPISRLICDVERFRDENAEIMTQQGMWVTYENTSNLNQLKLVTQKHKKEILKKYYDKHHKKFFNEVSKNLKKYGNCLIIDCHSFSSTPLPYELNQNSNRPNICLGTDNYHTPPKLIEKFKQLFIKQNYSVGINVPFSGTIVPIEYYEKNKNVNSIMIEINRSIYMNETTSEKLSNYNKIKDDIKNIIKIGVKSI